MILQQKLLREEEVVRLPEKHVAPVTAYSNLCELRT